MMQIDEQLALRSIDGDDLGLEYIYVVCVVTFLVILMLLLLIIFGIFPLIPFNCMERI